MGDTLKRVRRAAPLSPVKLIKQSTRIGTGTFGESRNIQKKTIQLQEKPFRKGASARGREARSLALKQQQTEQVRLAEAESEIATRRARGTLGRAGRRSLIQSSPAGLSTNLGGT